LRSGPVELRLDLRPNQTAEAIAAKLGRARPGQSLSTQLKKTLGLSAAAAALVHEAGPPPRDALTLGRHLKSIPLTITARRGLERAISSSGGIARSALTDTLMLDALPSVFAAGEMLDWDAPTGGYLLQASFSTGLAAARGVERWLAQKA
jgi:predicted flavoprotein YhiN